jgi:hypothetical protein
MRPAVGEPLPPSVPSPTHSLPRPARDLSRWRATRTPQTYRLTRPNRDAT